METTWLTVGLIGLVIGAVAFAFLGNTLAEDKRHHAVVHFFVATIASVAYTAMLLDLGVTLNEGHRLLYARYVDWSLTTPLLLLSLATVATHGRDKERFTLLGGLIGADLMMVVTGTFAALATDWERWVWYTVSSGAFLAVAWLVWVPTRADAERQGSARAGLFVRLATVLTALWTIYPVVFLLGPEGVDAFGGGTETACYAVLDVVAKTGFGLLLLTGVRALEGREGAPVGRPVMDAVRPARAA